MRQTLRNGLISIITSAAVSLASVNSKAEDFSDITDFSNTSKLKIGLGVRYSSLDVSDDLGFGLGGVSAEALTPYFNARYKFGNEQGFQPYLQFGVAQTGAKLDFDNHYLEDPKQSITSVGGGGGFIYKGGKWYTRFGVSAGHHFLENDNNQTDIRGSVFGAIDLSNLFEDTWVYAKGGYNSTGEQDNGINPNNTFSFEAGAIRNRENLYLGLGVRGEIIDGRLELPDQEKSRIMAAINVGFDPRAIFRNYSNGEDDVEINWGVHGHGYIGDGTKEVGIQFILNY